MPKPFADAQGVCECGPCINPVAGFKFRGCAPANRNALYNPALLHPRKEMTWLSQLTKNSKQNWRNLKNRVADGAEARSNSASAKKGALAFMGWDAFTLRLSIYIGSVCWKRHSLCAR